MQRKRRARAGRFLGPRPHRPRKETQRNQMYKTQSPPFSDLAFAHRTAFIVQRAFPDVHTGTEAPPRGVTVEF